jgi:MerR family transcriptional regulator, light-induced transcriptional regulator
LLNNHGIKISKIASLSNTEICTIASEILSTENTFQNQIESLTMSMIEMDEYRFESIISNSILKFGIEKSVIQIIYPFLVKVGVLWRTESINPSQEHFITNLIRQKIISAIDGQVLTPAKNNNSYMLFLPEHELHEISLLFYNYLLRKANFRTIYLGQSVPIEDIIKVCETVEPTYIISILTAGIKTNKVADYIRELSESCPKQKILLSGFQVTKHTNLNFPNVQFFKSPADFTKLIV